MSAGFKKHGIILNVTSDIYKSADIHIITGPHYAKDQWLSHERVILIDRAYYHPEKSGKWSSMDWLSVGWMNKLGGRDFIEGQGRILPEVKKSTGNKTIFLADYNGIVEKADIVRLHPAQKKYKTTLLEDLRQCHTATAYGTTSLVMAGLMGLKTVCKDKSSIMHQDNWLQLLPYADWRYSEIISGKLWEHLQLSLDRL